MLVRFSIISTKDEGHPEAPNINMTQDMDLSCVPQKDETIYLNNLYGYDWEGHVSKQPHHMISGFDSLQQYKPSKFLAVSHIPLVTVVIHPVYKCK